MLFLELPKLSCWMAIISELQTVSWRWLNIVYVKSMVKLKMYYFTVLFQYPFYKLKTHQPHRLVIDKTTLIGRISKLFESVQIFQVGG